MYRLLWMVGAAIGGTVGWWIGQKAGITTAYILSSVGTFAGVYLGIKVAREHFD